MEIYSIAVLPPRPGAPAIGTTWKTLLLSSPHKPVTVDRYPMRVIGEDLIIDIWEEYLAL